MRFGKKSFIGSPSERGWITRAAQSGVTPRKQAKREFDAASAW
jgi:hypothetical protein